MLFRSADIVSLPPSARRRRTDTEAKPDTAPPQEPAIPDMAFDDR